jgi:hypothetical protein
MEIQFQLEDAILVPGTLWQNRQISTAFDCLAASQLTGCANCLEQSGKYE